MSLITDITKKKVSVVGMEEPTPIAYLNVFEAGDIWKKIKGCDQCDTESRKACCSNCPFALDSGCMVHIQSKNQKPFYCVVNPPPDECIEFCKLEYECIEGSRKGTIRKVCEPPPWLL